MKQKQHMARILCVDDEPLNLSLLEAMLSPRGYDVVSAVNGPEALEKIAAERIDICLLDVMMPGMDGFEACRRIKSDDLHRNIPVVMVTSYADMENRIRGIEAGAEDFISKPFDSAEVLARIKMLLHVKALNEELRNAHDKLELTVHERTGELTRANAQLLQEIDERKEAEESLQAAFAEIKELKDRLQAENVYLQQEVAREYNFGEIIGQSNAISHVFSRIEQVAPQDATVLLLGETGTGKGVVARAIHSRSARKDRTMVTVNCTAMPANLIESELFGREKGAFTGADARQMGRFELADHGTIFLDEIGEMPLELQSKLLRVIQDGEFERLGSPRTIKVNVRIIAASNRNLEEEIKSGRFREDLFYRLNVFPITIPPLRQRKEDIPLLVNHFVAKFNKKTGKKIDDRVKRDPERPPGIPLARQRAGVGKCHRAGGNHQPGDGTAGIGPVRFYPEDRGTVRGGSQSPRRPGTGPHPPGAPENRLAHRGANRGSGAPRPQPQHPARPDAEIRHSPAIVTNRCLG